MTERKASRAQQVLQWVLILAVFVGVYAMASRPRPLPLVGQQAPMVSLPLAARAESEAPLQVKLSDFRGSVVVLDFWASWCTACRRSSPTLNALHEEFADRDVEFFGVNVEPISKSEVEQAHGEFGLTFPTLHDRAATAQRAYAIEMLPTVVVIGRDGTIAWAVSGVPGRSDLRDAISSALN